MFTVRLAVCLFACMSLLGRAARFVQYLHKYMSQSTEPAAARQPDDLGEVETEIEAFIVEGSASSVPPPAKVSAAADPAATAPTEAGAVSSKDAVLAARRAAARRERVRSTASDRLAYIRGETNHPRGGSSDGGEGASIAVNRSRCVDESDGGSGSSSVGGGEAQRQQAAARVAACEAALGKKPEVATFRELIDYIKCELDVSPSLLMTALESGTRRPLIELIVKGGADEQPVRVACG